MPVPAPHGDGHTDLRLALSSALSCSGLYHPICNQVYALNPIRKYRAELHSSLWGSREEGAAVGPEGLNFANKKIEMAQLTAEHSSTVTPAEARVRPQMRGATSQERGKPCDNSLGYAKQGARRWHFLGGQTVALTELLRQRRIVRTVLRSRPAHERPAVDTPRSSYTSTGRLPLPCAAIRRKREDNGCTKPASENEVESP